MDRLAPEEISGLPAAYIGTLTRMGERLAAAEAQIGGLKEDTGRIRSGLHDINNALMKGIAADQECSLSIRLLAEKVTTLSEQATARATASGEQIAEIVAELKNLTMVRARFEGGWWTMGKIVAFAAALGAAFAGVWGMLQHVKVTP